MAEMGALPTGTVTFLFTDIEGSTRRWEAHTAAMQATLARHDALLRAAIEGHGGHVFNIIGDAFCAAFDTAPDALAAAVDVQRALHAEDWGAAGPLRVRLALHTGAAEQREGDYFGPTLNRVARLLAAGHGGQVLLSAATAALVRDHLLGSMALRDLGAHRLKDLERPERIFQLVAPPLPSAFPPLRTLDARPHNLPVQATAFVGREREVAAVRARLLEAETRLVTFTGPGGMGKTRLALQVAAEVLEAFEHGVFVVELAAITDPTLVLPTIAQTLGVKEAPGRSVADACKDYLRDKQLLLVLDNFEQVVVAAPEVTALLAACPQVKALVTSRAALRLYGERQFPVPPLELPARGPLPPLDRLMQYEAVRLFIARAQDVRPDFAVTNENAPAVAELCHRLDGLPLAIELAAARARLLSPQALLARLERRLPVLTGGARDLPARQQTLRNTIAWSYDLLAPREQAFFRRLGVFAGGCTLAAAEAVGTAAGDLEADVLDEVAALVDSSLLRREEGEAAGGEPRFVMLETIREYALERLEERGEAGTVRQQHAAYYLALAERAEPTLTGPEQAAWLARLEGEHENLRAALGWALAQAEPEPVLRLVGALGRWWLVRGHWAEGRRWLARALAASSSAPAAPRAMALRWAGVLAWSQEDYATARPLLEESLALCRALGDKQGMAHSLVDLGHVAATQGDYATARALLEESLALARELGDERRAANVLNNLGSLARAQGDYAAARALLEESLALAREVGDKRGVAASLISLGSLARAQGDYAAARKLYEKSLTIWRELESKPGTAVSLAHIGVVALEEGDAAAARAALREALELCRHLGSRVLPWMTVAALGGVAALTSDAARAARLGGAAAALHAATGRRLPPADEANVARWLAPARAALDEATWAAAWAEGEAMDYDAALAYALATPPVR